MSNSTWTTWWKAKRNVLPVWTTPTYSGPFSDLSQECRDILVELVGIFHDIDRTILKGALLDQNMYKAFEEQGKSLGWPRQDKCHKSHFDEIDLSGLQQSITDCFNPDQKSTFDLLSTLKHESIDISTEAWSTAAVSLLEYQGHPVDSTLSSWPLAKNRARCILEKREDALNCFVRIEAVLKSRPSKLLYYDLKSKIEVLDGFEAVYNRQPKGERPMEPNFIRGNLSRAAIQKTDNVSHAYRQGRQERLSILLSMVLTTLSIIPLILAWQRSTNNHGTSKDTDFYLLIQSSILQLLGLFTAMFPIYRRSTTSAWRWAQIFTALGVLCSFCCIPLYLKAPTMWSALVSFYGAAAQAGMALLMAQLADLDDVPAAKKED